MLHLVSDSEPRHEANGSAHWENKRLLLARLLLSTEEVLGCAQNGAWDSVIELERERQQELKECFDGVQESNSPVIVEALATLLHMNGEITKLVQQAKEKLVNEQSNFEARKSVVSNYEQVSAE